MNLKINKYVICVLLFAGMVIGGRAEDNNHKIKLLSYNILEGMKMDTSKGKLMFVDWVKAIDPDILALQETNKFTEASLLELAKSYGHEYVLLAKETGYPVSLTSKYPMQNMTKVIEEFTHGYIYAQIKGYNFLVLHLNPFSWEKRTQEMTMILKHIKELPSQEKWLIMGDFNSVSPIDLDSHTEDYVKMVARGDENNNKGPKKRGYNLCDGKIDTSVQQLIIDAGYIDAVRVKHPYFISTCPSKGFHMHQPTPILSRYDYVYVSPDLVKSIITAEVIKDEFSDFYSDHYPILIEISLDN